ncbi:MAG: CBS domain-containing protein [Truepera sp.]|nr:CBS domain-containing protein [Truepera sp.]
MLRYLPKGTWFDTHLGDIARVSALHARPDEPVEDALQRMTENGLTAIPVMDPESQTFVGAVTNQEIIDLIVSEARGEH